MVVLLCLFTLSVAGCATPRMVSISLCSQYCFLRSQQMVAQVRLDSGATLSFTDWSLLTPIDAVALPPGALEVGNIVFSSALIPMRG